MPETKHRVFKFVGGPSRRRRRQGPRAATNAKGKKSSSTNDRSTEKNPAPSTPILQETALAPTSPQHSRCEDNSVEGTGVATTTGSCSGGAKEQTEIALPQASSFSDGCFLPVPSNLSPSNFNFFFESGDLDNSNGDNCDEVDNGGNKLEPNNSNFLNPFFDPDPMFGDPGMVTGHCMQLFNFLNPGIDYSQPLWPSSVALPMNMSHDFTCRDGAAQQPTSNPINPPANQPKNSGQPNEHPAVHRKPQHTEAWARLISRYDTEFCVLPLTHDFDANPFRHHPDPGTPPELILHCILALSYKHLDHDTGKLSKEAKHHKERALQLLSDMERDPNTDNFEPNLLDALLILMTLDCATSAHGPWISHLHRARVILEAARRLNILHTPRLEAQVGMLVWWDVTLALTSRQGCVLSESIIKAHFDFQSSKKSSFYSISGCPEDLFRYMIQLGVYAREFQLANNMTCVILDLEPVLVVEKSIQQWSAPEYKDLRDDYSISSAPNSPSSVDEEEALQYHQDLYHCAEAWRYALLVYIERVFKCRANKKKRFKTLGFLARKTLNNVSSCRKNLMLQKQLLLPVFLAGCETKDEYLRQEAKEYCDWWNEETRYDMFLTASALLQEVWETDDPNSWWGSIIDKKTRTTTAPAGRQYLFG